MSDETARIAYLLLAHEAAATVAARVREIRAYDPDGTVVVHYDAAAPAAAFAELRRGFADSAGVHVLAERAASGWGQFGLAAAALHGLRRLHAEAADVDFVHLMSVSCAPIRSIGAFKRHLAAHRDTDFIECAGPEWIIGGLRDERWTLHHPFNERKYTWWFNRSVQLQRLLGVKRRPPDGIVPRLGSQWWTLSWSTCAALLAYLDERPEVVRYFRTVWIPDECFFQSLVPHVRPRAERPGHNLTFYKFSNQGKPLVFYDDHAELLEQLPFFFARKISPHARGLRARLVARARAPGAVPAEVGRPTAAYEVKMRVQSAYPVPGQLFYGSQLAGEHAALLAAGDRPYVAICSLPVVLARLAARLPAEIPVQRVPAPADAAPVARVLATTAPAQLIASHARAARGRGVVLLGPGVGRACLDAVAADPRARLVVALPPAVTDGVALDLLLRLGVVTEDAELSARLHADAALHGMPLAAVLGALTDGHEVPRCGHRLWELAAAPGAGELPRAVAHALAATLDEDVLEPLLRHLPPPLDEALRAALAPPATAGAARLAG